MHSKLSGQSRTRFLDEVLSSHVLGKKGEAVQNFLKTWSVAGISNSEYRDGGEMPRRMGGRKAGKRGHVFCSNLRFEPRIALSRDIVISGEGRNKTQRRH